MVRFHHFIYHIPKKCAELVVLFQIHLITLGNIVSGEIHLKL